MANLTNLTADGLTLQDDIFIGTEQADTIVLVEDGEFPFAGLASNLLPVGGGDNFVAGTPNTPGFLQSDGDDQIYGLGGNDTIDAGRNDDFVYGGSGDDILHGRTGDDWIYGGDGRDVLLGESLHTSPGTPAPGPDGFASLDQLILDEQGDDHLFGGGETDTLLGFDGNDILEGGEDPDTLDGGAGNDQLTGGNHSDVFVFAAQNLGFTGENQTLDKARRVGPGHDTITDFRPGTDFLDPGDAIRLVGFQDASGAAINFAALDTDPNGVLDNADANVAFDPTGDTVINLTAFSPIHETSILTVHGSVDPLTMSDFMFS